MPIRGSISWEEFIEECARHVVTCTLTTAYLRAAALRIDEFHQLGPPLLEACRRLRPSEAESPALLLEVDATHRRFEEVKRSSQASRKPSRLNGVKGGMA